MSGELSKLMIAIDGSDASAAAVEEGLALAKEEGAHVVFAHVVPIHGEHLVPHERHAEHVPGDATTQLLQDAAARAAEAGVPCSTELVVGSPARQIAALADELDVDLVVVGSRRHKRIFLGSTSRSLLHESTRPILIVPEPAPVSVTT